MAEKSPILQALELNTKAIQGLHKGLEGDRKSKPSGGGTPSVDGAKKEPDGPKEIKEVKGVASHASDEIKARVSAVKKGVGEAVNKASEFAKGDFLKKIPILDKMGGNFIADVLKRKRDDKKRHKQEQKDEEQRVQDEEDTEEKRYLATQARAAGVSKFQFGGKEYDESDFKEESSVGSPDDSSEESSNLLSTLVSLAQQTNQLLIDGLGIRSPGYLHELLALSKGDKLKDRENLLEKKKDKKEEKEEKKKLGLTAKGMDFLGRGVKGMVGFLTNTMFPALGGLASLLAPVLLPILGAVLAIGGGYLIGTYVYNKWIGPLIDKHYKNKRDQMNRNDTFTLGEKWKTPEGEDIYQNTEYGSLTDEERQMFGEYMTEKDAQSYAQYKNSNIEDLMNTGGLRNPTKIYTGNAGAKNSSDKGIYEIDELNRLSKERADVDARSGNLSKKETDKLGMMRSLKALSDKEFELEMLWKAWNKEKDPDKKWQLKGDFNKKIIDLRALTPWSGNYRGTGSEIFGVRPPYTLPEPYRLAILERLSWLSRWSGDMGGEGRARFSPKGKDRVSSRTLGIDPKKYIPDWDSITGGGNKDYSGILYDYDKSTFDAYYNKGGGISPVPTDIDTTTQLDTNKNLKGQNINGGGGGGDIITVNNNNAAVDNSTIVNSPAVVQDNGENSLLASERDMVTN
jgi:hypothetical protein